jgi:5-methylcytosine-specific restriction protein B
MARYNELMAEKRISFVTFHQSYDYETFVEGLRPEIGEDESSSAGFRLMPTPGLFREICALADQARTQPRAQTDASALQLSQKRFWKMGQGTIGTEDDVYEDARDNGYIALGWVGP